MIRKFVNNMALTACFASIMILTGCQTGEYELEEGGPNDEKGTSYVKVTTEGPNLLENGGLEEWNMFPFSLDMPTGWFCHNDNNVKEEYRIVYEGKRSAKMAAYESGQTAIVNQRVAITTGHRLRIRFRYYVQQWKKNGARTYCYFRTGAAEKNNISTSDLKKFYGDDAYHIIRGGGYGKTYLPSSLSTWLTFDETIEVPPTAKYFVFQINSYYGTIMYVDDCYVMDIN